MICYFDASVLVALLTNDPSTPKARLFFQTYRPIPIVSDFAAAEFVSAVSRRVRTKELAKTEAVEAVSSLDLWMQTTATHVLTTSADIAAADAMIRRLDLPLRTPDALNIAICSRTGAMLATFDAQMKTCATALGLTLAPT